jgi:hypothetical protein
MMAASGRRARARSGGQRPTCAGAAKVAACGYPVGASEKGSYSDRFRPVKSNRCTSAVGRYVPFARGGSSRWPGSPPTTLAHSAADEGQVPRCSRPPPSVKLNVRFRLTRPLHLAELDLRQSRGANPRWRVQSFAEARRRSRQFRRRTAVSDGHELALPTLRSHSQESSSCREADFGACTAGCFPTSSGKGTTSALPSRL